MKLIISPAKKMNVDVDSPIEPSMPRFLGETRAILDVLQGMEGTALQKLWKCNDSIAKLNRERLKDMALDRCLTPAVLAYEGIQYRYMAPHVLTGDGLDYLQEHLRILSGFYGVLRPFDGVTPYRLEMGSGLSVGGEKHLYAFWGRKLAEHLAQSGEPILNLASKEYSRAVQPHLPPHIPFITCTFGERKGDAIVEKGTMCKMARGQMVRWLAEHNITDPEEVKGFDQLDYVFSEERSREGHLVFVKR